MYKKSLEMVAADPRLYLRPAGQLLDRLKQFQSVFPIGLDGQVYLVNASEKHVDMVQCLLDAGEYATGILPENFRSQGKRLVVEKLTGLSVTKLPLLPKNPGAATQISTAIWTDSTPAI